MRILLLGGTTEASALARLLAEAGADAVFSYAGRTGHPVPQPLPTRIGGFGGVEGLRAFLQGNAITHVVDATHPFAAQMSHHAVVACDGGPALIALERAPWVAGPGDTWHRVPDMEQAVAALPATTRRIFLAIGRQELPAFAGAAHHYLLRLVDPPPEPPLPGCTVVIARGPFTVAGDAALIRDHSIDLIVTKNSGGSGARAKLDAARALGVPVIVVDRPAMPARLCVPDPAAVMRWLGHPADRGV